MKASILNQRVQAGVGRVEIVNALDYYCCSWQYLLIRHHLCLEARENGGMQDLLAYLVYVGTSIFELNIQLKKFNSKFNSSHGRKARN